MRFRISDFGFRIGRPRAALTVGLCMAAFALMVVGPVPVWAAIDTDAVVESAPGAPPVTIDSVWEAALFYIVGGTAALTALGCVLSTNIVRMATCLFGTLGSVAILYFLMSASFLGAIQLIVYAGGTLIVIVFGIMLTSKSPWVRYAPKPVELVAGAVVFLGLFAGLAGLLLRAEWGDTRPNAAGFEVAQIGWSLLTTYFVPFELASVLLLAVMIGAAYLARPERGE